MPPIATRGGDKGRTSLGDGTRVPKDHDNVEAYGTVDELVSILGVCRCLNISEETRTILKGVQRTLFQLAADLADPTGGGHFLPDTVRELDTYLEDIEPRLPPIITFEVPGRNQASSMLHVARTVARRTERRIVVLGEGYREHLRYMNRLSDLLFILARWEGGPGSDIEPPK